jgi:hypothetical protein
MADVDFLSLLSTCCVSCRQMPDMIAAGITVDDLVSWQAQYSSGLT